MHFEQDLPWLTSEARNDPDTAQQIIEWRTTNGPFQSVDELDDVPGIGPARIEQLREAVTP
jgi:DNA uptake protein ComE-like DNA-binding protein